jgi:hypothetical protein
MLRLHATAKPIDVTLLVGALHDAGQYNTVGGVSATTLVDRFRLFPLLGKQTAIFDELRGMIPAEFANDLETVEPMGMAWHSAMEAVGDACDGIEDLARMIGADEGETVGVAASETNCRELRYR